MVILQSLRLVNTIYIICKTMETIETMETKETKETKETHA